jgi:hypothetical protein
MSRTRARIGIGRLPGGPNGFRMIAVLVLAAAAFSAPALAAPVFEWSDLYDGGANLTDLATAILTDPEGNVIIGGESGDGIAGVDWLIRKLARETHATIWSRRVPFIDTNDMALSGMVWDGNGDILAGGFSRGCVG